MAQNITQTSTSSLKCNTPITIFQFLQQKQSINRFSTTSSFVSTRTQNTITKSPSSSDEEDCSSPKKLSQSIVQDSNRTLTQTRSNTPLSVSPFDTPIPFAPPCAEFKIVSHKPVDKSYVIYKVAARIDGVSWTFFTRYSCLLGLNEELKKVIRGVPDFPKKKLWGKLNEDFIQYRIKELNLYFSRICNRKDVIRNEAWTKFVSESQKFGNIEFSWQDLQKFKLEDS